MAEYFLTIFQEGSIYRPCFDMNRGGMLKTIKDAGGIGLKLMYQGMIQGGEQASIMHDYLKEANATGEFNRGDLERRLSRVIAEFTK